MSLIVHHSWKFNLILMLSKKAIDQIYFELSGEVMG